MLHFYLRTTMTLRLIHNTVLMGSLAGALLLVPIGTFAANITTERVAGRDAVVHVPSTVAEIATRYGVDRSRVFGMGHSNGAMLTQRVMCETSVYAAAVPISGGLENGASSCPTARGKRIMAIHGADDQNVPVAGGRGAKGLSRVAFNSETATAQVWKDSGAEYDLQIIPGASHGVDSINAQLVKTQSQSLAQKIARFFGLLPAAR